MFSICVIELLMLIINSILLNRVSTVKLLCWSQISDTTSRCSGYIGQYKSESGCCDAGGMASTIVEDEINTLVFQYRLGLKPAPCRKCASKCKSKPCSKEIDCPKCKCELDCDLNSGQICGADGVTYENECSFNKEKCINQPSLEVAYIGECRAFCRDVKCLAGKSCIYDNNGTSLCIVRQCPKSCESEDIVCGSNGKTYLSHCHMLQDSCDTNKLIVAKYPGKCQVGVTCNDIKCEQKQSCVTNKDGKPMCIQCCREEGRMPLRMFDICGSNGKIYKDWCDIRQESCVTGKLIGVDFSWRLCMKPITSVF